MVGIRRLRGSTALGFLLASWGACAGLAGAGPALAQPPTTSRAVRYHGLAVRIPRSWPVFNLARDPHACVRFNRHAVYLGTPGSEESCPAHSVGRTGAILISPLKASPGAQIATAAGLGLEGNVASFTVRSAGAEVTATWARSQGLVAQALGRKSLPATGESRFPARGTAPPGGGGAVAGTTAPPAASHTSASVYTGRGFDACSAPSRRQMKAWSASPDRAVGIYVGGPNEGCAQPNLSKRWVSRELAAGWHPFPIYVSLQAPRNDCGCGPMTANPRRAKAEGRAAAGDAVTRAKRFGIGVGNPVYDDMEGYANTARNKRAVLAFLAGWTSRLHAAGYISGVYSSANSGVVDLAEKYRKGYPEPNDIWIADWNGRKTTSDPYVPRGDWRNNRRIHQYAGGRNETYGGVTLNVDDNYLDAATVGEKPLLGGYLLLTSRGAVHKFGRATAHGSDSGRLPPGVTAVALAKDRKTGGYWILQSNGGVGNFDAPAEGSLKDKLGARRPVSLAATSGSGYLILTPNGGVHPFGSAVTYGSDADRLPRGVSAVALAVDPKTGGYWILRSNGGVDAFNAPSTGSLRYRLHGTRPVALAATPRGGYLILTANGAVHPFGLATSYGSDRGRLPRHVRAIAVATSPSAGGYRILRSDGGVEGFHAPWYGSLRGRLAAGARPAALAASGR